MTKLALSSFIIFFFLYHTSTQPVGRLVWSDEFNGPHVDRSKWDYEISCRGGGNNELQCYIDHASTLEVENGYLVFRPIFHKNGYKGSLEGCTDVPTDTCTWVQPFTSARIRTLKAVDASWKFGYFEIRAKLPKGNFLWPAVWMLPTDKVYGEWAASGEIDILEFRGQEAHIIEHALHHGGVWPYNTYTGSGKLGYATDFTENFHVFALKWTPDRLTWYIDNVESYTLSLDRSWWSGSGPNPYPGNRSPFDQTFHMILNVAIGGNFFPREEYGDIVPEKDIQTWTSQYMVDYVRVYSEENTENSENLEQLGNLEEKIPLIKNVL